MTDQKTDPAAYVTAWNAANPVGTQGLLLKDNNTLVMTEVEHEAYVAEAGASVAFFKGVRGFYQAWRFYPVPYPAEIASMRDMLRLFIEAGEASGWNADESPNAMLLTVARDLFKGISATTSENPHDPLTRKLPEEEHFALMGRDVLAPGLLRYYAALILKQIDKADAIHARLKDVARARTPRPQKDKDHAWSARAIADRMEGWFKQYMTGAEPTNLVNTAPEREFPEATIDEIKNARPTGNPEDGQ